jgi:hypothetical protein
MIFLKIEKYCCQKCNQLSSVVNTHFMVVTMSRMSFGTATAVEVQYIVSMCRFGREEMNGAQM